MKKHLSHLLPPIFIIGAFHLGMQFNEYIHKKHSINRLNIVETGYVLRKGIESLIEEDIKSGNTDSLKEHCLIWNDYASDNVVANFRVTTKEHRFNQICHTNN